MADLIDRSEAINAVSKSLKRVFVEYNEIAEKIISKVPSVEHKIIYCKDCKYYFEVAKNIFWCENGDGLTGSNPKPYDFCSRSEKRIEE